MPLPRFTSFRKRAGSSSWPDGSPAALSLSFDDARSSQPGRGLEVLEQLGVSATFFVGPRNVERDLRGWRTVVDCGHEIGNHSVSHPCTANLRWARSKPLEWLSIADIEADLHQANREIDDLLGVAPSVFAYPCGQTFVGRGVDCQSYVPVVARMFDVGRTFNDMWANSPRHCDLAQVAAMNCDELSFAQLRGRLQEALSDGAWIVLGGHEVGDVGHEVTSTSTIEAVVAWCRDEGVRIGTIGATGRDVAAVQRRDQGSSGARPSAPSTGR
jgi:peptidoglycan/xylan/chitin deacetylase (PgdA/CDA1 family)